MPAQPGISSLVRRGARRGSLRRYLTVSIHSPVREQLERAGVRLVPFAVITNGRRARRIALTLAPLNNIGIILILKQVKKALP